MQLSYHNIHLNNIKRNTGCSFIGFEKTNESYKVKTIKNGDKEWFTLNGQPSDITPVFYAELEELIKQRYEQL